jgi:hypothetical protein
MPSLIDILVFSTLGGIGILPYALSYLRKPVAKPLPAPTPVADTHTEWQTRWTNTLIQLLNELDEKNQANAIDLTRDLMWEIIGGSDKPVAQGKK